MDPVEAPRDELAALLDERAWIALDARAIRVTGEDATTWLHDLLTADVASLAPGRARRSLLLSPTGRIRADLTVARVAEGLVLVQDRDAEAVDAMLAPYVLSSRVRLDASAELEAVAAPPGTFPPAVETFEPAVVAPGAAAVVSRGSVAELGAALDRAGLVRAGAEALEAWRILRGSPRIGADLDASSLPAEAGLDATIDRTKGCFLGQESVARVAGLGHPPRVLRHVLVDGDVGPADPVTSDGARVGEITSAARDLGGRTIAIARVMWAARDAPLTAGEGVRLTPLPPSD